MQVTAIKSIHIIIQELMNLLHRNKFSPWEDFFVNPFGSDVISPNQLCMYVYQYRCWSKHMQWNNEEILLQGSIIVSLTLCLLVPIVYYDGRY